MVSSDRLIDKTSDVAAVSSLPEEKRPVMRGCMLSFYFYPEYSGSAIQAISVARMLISMGVQTTIVAAKLSNVGSREVVDGIPLRRLPVCRFEALKIPSFWLMLAAYLIWNRNSYDFIHAHGTIQHSVAGIVGRILKKPTFLKIAMSDSDIAFDRQGRLWGALQRWLVSKFDQYIATSSEIERELLESGLATKSNLLRITNGVDMTRFGASLSPDERRERREKLGLSAAPLVLFVGIISERKNLKTILNVWCRLRDRGVAGQVVCVGPLPGEGDAERQYFLDLQAFVEANDLRDTVRFVGRAEDPAPYYLAADVFFFPSRREGMPNAVIEAMSAGLPCLVGDFSGARDLVRDGIDGWVIADSEREYTSRLELLLTGQRRRVAMGESARSQAEARFSLTHVAGELKAAYAAQLIHGASR